MKISDQIEYDEMGGSFSTSGDQKYQEKIGLKMKWENILEDQSVWENNIKKNIKQTGWDIMEWINLAQDRDKCSYVHDNLRFSEI